MVQFKGLTLIIVAIISLKILSCCGGKGIVNKKDEVATAEKGNQMKKNDTLFLSIKDYRIVSVDDNVLDIEVINNQAVSSIRNVKYSIIKIELEEGDRIAKGNDLLSSFIPQQCDYFYPLDKGYVLVVNNRINFRKIAK